MKRGGASARSRACPWLPSMQAHLPCASSDRNSASHDQSCFEAPWYQASRSPSPLRAARKRNCPRATSARSPSAGSARAAASLHGRRRLRQPDADLVCRRRLGGRRGRAHVFVDGFRSCRHRPRQRRPRDVLSPCGLVGSSEQHDVASRLRARRGLPRRARRGPQHQFDAPRLRPPVSRGRHRPIRKRRAAGRKS
jgi:hypothetical protein